MYVISLKSTNINNNLDYRKCMINYKAIFFNYYYCHEVSNFKQVELLSLMLMQLIGIKINKKNQK